MLLLLKPHDNLRLDTMSTQPASLLLSLPAELRNQIWETLLIQRGYEGKKETRFCANVLRTCKQINAEGTSILYGENTFLAHPSLLAELPSCLLVTRPSRIKLPPVKHLRVAKMIRKYYIHVRLDTDPRFSKTQATESFSNIDSLEIEVFQAMFGSCNFDVLSLFEGVRGLGKAKVQGSVGDGNYARWLEHSMMSSPGTEVPPFVEKFVGGIPSWDAWTRGNR